MVDNNRKFFQFRNLSHFWLQWKNASLFLSSAVSLGTHNKTVHSTWHEHTHFSILKEETVTLPIFQLNDDDL